MKVVAIVGSTGTGKSDLAVDLAHRIGGEVVNADSMQVYRGMDIGTAKLTPDQRGGVPHHLLDIWDVSVAANVSSYRDQARAAIADIAARGRVPILVGGSGLYVRAVLDDMQFAPQDPQVRAALEARLAAEGSAALHHHLATLDPRAAANIDPANGRRVVRALEVVDLTGGPYAAALPDEVPVYEDVRIGLRRPRVDLDAALEARIDRMWLAGFVAEVRALDGLAGSPTASRALGYRQILEFLTGSCDEQQARDATIRATRKFARRQESWFGRDTRINWIEASSPEHAQPLVATFLADAPTA